MGIKIDKNRCIGCDACVAHCPGNLIYLDKEEKAVMRCNRDCWDCASCIKACPTKAIKMFLPEELGGKGAYIEATNKKDEIIWQITKANGEKEEIKVKKSSTFDV